MNLNSISISHFFNNLTKVFISTLFFIFSLLLVFTLCRLSFIVNTGLIQGEIGADYSFTDIVTALFNGARYDARTIAAIGLVYLIIYCLTPTRKKVLVTTILASIIVLVEVFFSVANIGFYDIYKDTFNAMLLGLVYDDQQALMGTALSGEYNLIFRTFIVLLSLVIFVYIYKFCSKKIVKLNLDLNSKSKRIVSVVFAFLSLYLIAVLIASNFQLKGGSLNWFVTPAKDSFLRKATPGALKDLGNVIKLYKSLEANSYDEYAQGETIENEIKTFFKKDIVESNDLSQYLKKKVIGGTNDKVQHVFIIIGESLSNWHFQPLFDEVNLTAGLKEIGTDKNGKQFNHFIMNSSGTIGTVDVMLTSMFMTGLPISQLSGTTPQFLSTVKNVKQLGYTNNFYYFGNPAWRNIDKYVIDQGFDKMYSVGDFDSNERGVWGVSDTVGFDYIIKNTLANIQKPTFNMILTTSYHPPYDVPLQKYNAPLNEIKDFLDHNFPEKVRANGMNTNIMAHAWYANQAIYNFVKEVQSKLPNSLIVITGDHYDRRYPSVNRPLDAANEIPLIIYGKNVDKAIKIANIGSHIDIMPTVYELIAPKDFEYYSLGEPLLSLDHSTEFDANRMVYGSATIATQDFIADLNGNFQPFNNNTTKQEMEDKIKQGLKMRKAGLDLSYFIIRNGYNIQGDSK